MSEFFEQPPPPPTDEEAEECFRQPPWYGPPHGTLAGVVALELVLARSEKVAVCIGRLAAYPTGFGFELIMMSAPGIREPELDPFLLGHRSMMRRRGEQGLPPELLRIGVQFADGRKATNTASDFHDPAVPPPGPVIHSGGGGGGGGSWRQEEWVWPLPPSGPLAFVCEWPAAKIPLTRREMDAALILDAAGRSQAIFPHQPNHQYSSGGWTTYARVQTTRPKPVPDGE